MVHSLQGNGESIDHFFLHYPVTIGLWHKLFNLVGLVWVPPRSFEDMLVIAFKGLGNSLRGKTLWQIVCLTLIWMVWEWLWEEVGAIRGIWEGPWCLGGDFNITLAQGERSRQGRITSAMRRFAEVVDDLGLVDLQLQGGAFTWTGGLNNMSRAHLDRFLVSPCWLDQFSRVSQRRLPRSISDHFLVLLEGGSWRRGPASFRFENMWFKDEGFKELIRSWWQGIEVRGSASFRLSAKLKDLKQKLKVWNREEFGNLESNKEAAIQQVEYWDRVEDEMSLSMEELTCKKEAKEDYAKWVDLEETHWRQTSRELWLKAEEWEIREGIVNAFKQQFSESSEWKADIGSLPFNQICVQEAEMLEDPFTEGEVQSALMEMNGDKAPGPDGFFVFFWQCCWDFVKEEIMEMFKEFHDQNTFLKSINNTFLVLIPKKGGAEDFGDFRQILDASLMANEVIDNWNKKGDKGVICKLDIEKAYDSINWQFLLKVMVKMGFGAKWLRWMWWCISTAKFSVMVNGTPIGFFSSSKGLRQGDPLSPYLFVMGMEVLSVLIRRAMEGGFISGCKIQRDRGRPVHIAHLLFADDTIVFSASGLRINLAKSEVIPVGEVQRIEEMAVELGCRVGQLSSVYLGLPLGVPNKAAYGWDGHASVPDVVIPYAHLCGKKIKKIAKRLLVGGGGGLMERKTHLVKWDMVCGDKENGGLGIRKFTIMNKALLGKWTWRFASDKEALWKHVLEAKYGQEDYGWRTKRLWVIKSVSGLMCGAGMQRCPKGSRISTFGSQQKCKGELLQALRGVRITWEDDSIFWKGGGSGQFRVKDAYSWLDRSMDVNFPKIRFG
ncbi:LINE-1 reverse transcriptase-like [Vitis vinifera]|uniref:LINE-1 reverse transcriptase-like n=1 Tax=Vitis vinifera TaxID=29760 RepID=A0A438F2L2_VITVI|nr:LINE-1 reverse transcriptase-like [Vitis vinifera]